MTKQGCNFKEAEDGLQEAAALQVQKDSWKVHGAALVHAPPDFPRPAVGEVSVEKDGGPGKSSATRLRLTRVP